MHAVRSLVVRELRLAIREGGALGTALGFNLVVVAMLPLSLGPDLNLLARIAGGLLWVSLLLSALLSLPRLFEADYDDGVLELFATAPLPLEVATAVKALAHWLSTGIPLTLMAPLLGLMLNLELSAYPVLLATMLAGTPAISFIGAVGAALTLRSRRGGLLIALLVLPLYIPTLIFGISAMEASALGTGGFGPSLLILTAISLASLVLGPVAAAAALRMQLG
jgi:heme exporter protein B